MWKRAINANVFTLDSSMSNTTLLISSFNFFNIQNFLGILLNGFRDVYEYLAPHFFVWHTKPVARFQGLVGQNTFLDRKVLFSLEV